MRRHCRVQTWVYKPRKLGNKAAEPSKEGFCKDQPARKQDKHSNSGGLTHLIWKYRRMRETMSMIGAEMICRPKG